MFWSEMQGMQPCTVAQVPRCRELQSGLGRLSQWRRLRREALGIHEVRQLGQRWKDLKRHKEVLGDSDKVERDKHELKSNICKKKYETIVKRKS